MPEPSEKEIQKLKIAVTADCCLDCRHCFIDKNGREVIKPEFSRKAVDALLDSPGREKKLELYGGEALLKLPVLEEIVRYALRRARESRKKLAVWLASNGIPLGDREIEFIRKNGIILSISLYGTQKTHDYIRRFPGGGGTFKTVKSRLAKVFSKLDPLKVTALLCVHPEFAARAFEDFVGIAELGFRVINIECVHGFPWTAQNLSDFGGALRRIGGYLMAEAKKGRFLILEPFIELSGRGRPRQKIVCPFLKDLEMYPDGTFSLYPFGFVDMKKYGGLIAVGRAEAGFSERFRHCRSGSSRCPGCVKEYYQIPGMSGGSFAYALRTSALESLFYSILKTGAPYSKRYLKLVLGLSRAYRRQLPPETVK